jgi:hypothetical protein
MIKYSVDRHYYWYRTRNRWSSIGPAIVSGGDLTGKWYVSRALDLTDTGIYNKFGNTGYRINYLR